MEDKKKNSISDVSRNLSEPEWLLRFREKHLEISATLPVTEKYGLGIAGIPAEAEHSLEGTAEYFVDASRGVEIYTWKEAVTQEEIAPYLERLLQSELFPAPKTKPDALSLAHFRSGIVLYAQPHMEEDGTFREEKLTLTTTLSAGSAADVVIVIVKEGAKLSLQNMCTGGVTGGLFARTIVLLVEGDAQVRVSEREEMKNGMMLKVRARALVSAHGSAAWKALSLSSASVARHTDALLIGEGASTEIIDGMIAKENAFFDISASAIHLASSTYSRIHSAGLGFDSSKTVYRGLIDMKSGVSAVDGAQEGRFITASRTAKIDAIPSLDIASKDVRCVHKLSITHVRDEDIFYPKLRGLSDTESRMLFLEGSFADIFPEEENEAIMEDIRKTLAAHNLARP